VSGLLPAGAGGGEACPPPVILFHNRLSSPLGFTVDDGVAAAGCVAGDLASAAGGRDRAAGSGVAPAGGARCEICSN